MEQDLYFAENIPVGSVFTMFNVAQELP